MECLHSSSALLAGSWRRAAIKKSEVPSPTDLDQGEFKPGKGGKVWWSWLGSVGEGSFTYWSLAFFASSLPTKQTKLANISERSAASISSKMSCSRSCHRSKFAARTYFSIWLINIVSNASPIYSAVPFLISSLNKSPNQMSINRIKLTD